MRRLVLIVLIAAAAIIPSLSLHGGHAQTATGGPQGDEFNNTQFTYPFAVYCGGNATQPCPDPQGPTTWSLNTVSPGYLRIMTQFGSLIGGAADASNNARNLVLQPVSPTADYTVTTSLTFPAGTNNITTLGQTAGAMVYQDDDHWLYIARVFANNQAVIEFRQEDGAGNEFVNNVTETGVLRPQVYLRITKTGTLYQAYYSYDNTTFTQIGPGNPTSPTATLTPVATSTGTPAVSPTATATTTPPTGYTASYANPKVGVFAWGGTNTAVNNAMLPADFDWFRVGSNDLTPAPSPTATNTNTPGPTSTATVTSTATATGTAVPATATATLVPTNTATATATVVPSNTPIPTATPRPKHKAAFGFSYASVWYHYIHIGTRQHIQVQAKQHARQGIWVVVQFATGKIIRFYAETDKHGFWATEFNVPGGTISRYSGRAAVTFQLWRGSKTKKTATSFYVIP